MVHVRFDPSSISHYSHQVGYGLGELSYFKGLPPYQRGAGFGDIFKGIRCPGTFYKRKGN